MAPEELEKLKEKMEERTEMEKESERAMKEGKGVLTLEKPINARNKEITQLVYDFNELTGMDYISAMDCDEKANQIFRITAKQAINLFALAVEKCTEDVDRYDIIAQIGMSDSVIAIMYSTVFFTATVRAGKIRISRR